MRALVEFVSLNRWRWIRSSVSEANAEIMRHCSVFAARMPTENANASPLSTDCTPTRADFRSCFDAFHSVRPTHRTRFTFFILNFSRSRANSCDYLVTLLFAIKRLLVFPFNHRQEIIRSSLKIEETLGFLFPTFSVLVR